MASTIGLISIEIFGYHNPSARDYAVNLGKALQMVNILRDLESDARRGRLYLPGEDLERFGLRPAEILEGRYSDPFIELMQFECDRARGFFDQARAALAPEDRRAMVSAEIMGAIYWRVLGRIRARRYNVFGERVRISRPLKFWTALSVYMGREWSDDDFGFSILDRRLAQSAALRYKEGRRVASRARTACLNRRHHKASSAPPAEKRYMARGRAAGHRQARFLPSTP